MFFFLLKTPSPKTDLLPVLKTPAPRKLSGLSFSSSSFENSLHSLHCTVFSSSSSPFFCTSQSKHPSQLTGLIHQGISAKSQLIQGHLLCNSPSKRRISLCQKPLHGPSSLHIPLSKKPEILIFFCTKPYPTAPLNPALVDPFFSAQHSL